MDESELERLAILAEELGEAQQMVGKVLRFGYESRHPTTHKVNRRRLEQELGHVLHAIDMLTANKDVLATQIQEARLDKRENIHKYTMHQGDSSG